MAKETHSIRMEQNTYDALAEYARQKAASLAEAIEALLNNVATTDVAKIAPERAAEIETFERAVKTILDMFLHSLTIKDNVAAQAREVVNAELSEKDARICVLETELVEAREKSATLQRALDESEAARTAAEARADRVDMSKLYVLMSEIKQMYLNAYYGEKHFTETLKPTADDLGAVQDDAVKKAYRPGRKQ